MSVVILIVLGIFSPSIVFCIEPVSMGIIAAGGAAISGIGLMYCQVKECCTEKWTNHNVSTIGETFDKEVIAQHLVNRIVSKTIKSHLKKDSPKKALVLSFHGWTGSGKNYVADIVAKHVYKKGTKSYYVHKYIAHYDFPNPNEIQIYKEKLRKDIIDKTKLCGRSMFIFDEMEKMPQGVADVLKAFLDYHSHIEQVDYRKNIFIFLSNTVGDVINKETYRHFKSGKAREDITAKQMERILSVSSFNMPGGFKDSNLILSGLVDFFVPFLPMEKEHVKQCIRAEIKRRGEKIDESIVKEVTEELEYFPKNSGIFSTTGCKMVSKKLDAFI